MSCLGERLCRDGSTSTDEASWLAEPRSSVSHPRRALCGDSTVAANAHFSLWLFSAALF